MSQNYNDQNVENSATNNDSSSPATTDQTILHDRHVPRPAPPTFSAPPAPGHGRVRGIGRGIGRGAARGIDPGRQALGVGRGSCAQPTQGSQVGRDGTAPAGGRGSDRGAIRASEPTFTFPEYENRGRRPYPPDIAATSPSAASHGTTTVASSSAGVSSTPAPVAVAAVVPTTSQKNAQHSSVWAGGQNEPFSAEAHPGRVPGGPAVHASGASSATKSSQAPLPTISSPSRVAAAATTRAGSAPPSRPPIHISTEEEIFNAIINQDVAGAPAYLRGLLQAGIRDFTSEPNLTASRPALSTQLTRYPRREAFHDHTVHQGVPPSNAVGRTDVFMGTSRRTIYEDEDMQQFAASAHFAAPRERDRELEGGGWEIPAPQDTKGRIQHGSKGWKKRDEGGEGAA